MEILKVGQLNELVQKEYLRLEMIDTKNLVDLKTSTVLNLLDHLDVWDALFVDAIDWNDKIALPKAVVIRFGAKKIFSIGVDPDGRYMVHRMG